MSWLYLFSIAPLLVLSDSIIFFTCIMFSFFFPPLVPRITKVNFERNLKIISCHSPASVPSLASHDVRVSVRLPRMAYFLYSQLITLLPPLCILTQRSPTLQPSWCSSCVPEHIDFILQFSRTMCKFSFLDCDMACSTPSFRSECYYHLPINKWSDINNVVSYVTIKHLKYS